MDSKKSSQKHSSKQIPYVRTDEGPSGSGKPHHGPNYIFQYRTSFIAVLFSTLLTGCFVMIMIYFNMQTDHYVESLQAEKEFPYSSRVSLDIDPAMRTAVIEMASDKDMFIPNIPFLQNEVEASTRQKRQVNVKNPADCKSRPECPMILQVVREATETMNSQFEKMKNRLVELEVLSADDPHHVNYQKIMDCLECANAISHKQDDGFFDDLPHNDHHEATAPITDVLPYFDNQHSAEDEEQEKSAEVKDQHTSDDRIGRGLTQQVLQSETNSSKLSGGAKITEIIRNTTIIEKEQADEVNNNNANQGFHHRPVDMQNTGGESHVTRNIPSPMAMPTAETIYQQHQQQQSVNSGPNNPNNIPPGLHPFILPTAETTKYSQQIQITPQAGNPPLIPVCFYSSPPSGVAAPQQQQQQQQQQQPFFVPQGMNQPPKFFPTNGPSMTPFNFQSNLPSQFFHSGQPQTPIPLQPPFPAQPPFPRNAPYYCTYISASSLPQQSFSQMPMSNGFPNPFVGMANNPNEKDSQFGQQSNGFPNSFVGMSNNPNDKESQLGQQSNVFSNMFIGMANNPNDKESQLGQQSNGYSSTFVGMTNIPRGKEPQLGQQPNGFPNTFVGMTNNFREKEFQVGQQANGVKTTYDDSDEKYWTEYCDGFTCPPPYKKCIKWSQRCDGKADCIGAEDEIGCPIILDPYYTRFAPPQWQPRPMQSPPNDARVHEGMTKTVTTYMATTMMPVIDTTDTNEVETTTFKMPELPKQFTCKRIIQTVSLEKRCNGVFDCEDASDEEGCTCKDYLQQQRPYAVCDGHVDCDDGTDEQGCNFCPNDQYHCHRSGGCIPRSKVCNQANDCKLNEDELDCLVLTDGKRVNLDLDNRPHLNLAGVVTRYDRGAWRPQCVKSEQRGHNTRMDAGQKICEYLGFSNVDSVSEVVVPTSRLEVKSATGDMPIGYEYPPRFTPLLRGENNTCYGLFVRCKPILSRKVNVNLKIDPLTKTRSYIWPWEGSVFVDGKYHCPAVLLENDLLLTSAKCSENVDLRHNYTTAVFGVSSPDMPYSGPYQQVSQVLDIKPIKNSEASLFRLKHAVNMTRYVQPIYMEKRIFPASTGDSCVALGVNGRGQRRVKFLSPVVDDCPKCHRCYSDVKDVQCSRANETINWSGNIVCLSTKGGWYPTAVFQDKDENCGFSMKQTLNSIDYIHAHLSEAIEERRSRVEELECEGVRCSFGACIPWNRVCDGVRDCRDGADENHATCSDLNNRCKENIANCKCSQSELRCSSGKCVPKESFCDGKFDCEDGSDEPASCTCAEYLKLTKPTLVCDNRRHCLDKSDEDPRHCSCKDNSFKCTKSSRNDTMICVSPDVVCDGQPDCPEGEDEADHACLTIKSGPFEAHGKGDLQRRSYGVWQSVCMPEPVNSQSAVQTACVKMGYRNGLLLDGAKQAESVYVPRNDFYMFQLNSHTWITLREDNSFGVWIKPTMPCYRLHIQCF